MVTDRVLIRAGDFQWAGSAEERSSRHRASANPCNRRLTPSHPEAMASATMSMSAQKSALAVKVTLGAVVGPWQQSKTQSLGAGRGPGSRNGGDRTFAGSVVADGGGVAANPPRSSLRPCRCPEALALGSRRFGGPTAQRLPLAARRASGRAAVAALPTVVQPPAAAFSASFACLQVQRQQAVRPVARTRTVTKALSDVNMIVGGEAGRQQRAAAS